MTIPDSTSSQYKSAHQVMTPQLQLFAVSQNIPHSRNSIFTRFLAIVASISVNGKYILRIPTVRCYFTVITHLYNKTLLS